MNTEIKGIGFDFGRVLGNFNHEAAIASLSEKCGVAPELVKSIIFEQGLSALHESGAINSHEFYNRFCGGVIIDEDSLPFEVFAHCWSKIFSPNPGVAKLLARLRPELPRVILSNTDPLHWIEIEKLDAVRLFFSRPNSAVRSFDVGARKPAERMYQAMLDRLGLSPQEFLYIDDIEAYVSAFRDMGGHAEVYDCTLQPLSRLEEILSTHECLLDTL